MHERPTRPLPLGVTWSTKPHLGNLPSGHCHGPFKKACPKHALHYHDYQLPDHLYSLQKKAHANANLHGVALSHYDIWYGYFLVHYKWKFILKCRDKLVSMHTTPGVCLIRRFNANSSSLLNSRPTLKFKDPEALCI